jgi:hypothetical protein
MERWDMTRHARPVTDRELRAWLALGEVDRGVGKGLTFLASATAAREGKALWVLRLRMHGRSKEKGKRSINRVLALCAGC